MADRLFTRPDIAGCYVVFRCTRAEETVRVTDALRQDGIDFRFWYGQGVHQHRYFAGLPHQPLKVTDDFRRISSACLSRPTYRTTVSRGLLPR